MHPLHVLGPWELNRDRERPSSLAAIGIPTEPAFNDIDYTANDFGDPKRRLLDGCLLSPMTGSDIPVCLLMLGDVQTLDDHQDIRLNTNESIYCTTAQKSNDETQHQGRFCLITARGGSHVPTIRRDIGNLPVHGIPADVPTDKYHGR